MGKVKRRDAKARNFLLTVLAIGIVLAVVSSTSLAVPAPSAGKSSVQSGTVLDPFTLRTTVVPDASKGVRLSSAGGLIQNPCPRRDIRIPNRPNKRSGFRPHDDC